MIDASEVVVRRLRHDDLAKLQEWLNEPHLVPFYMREQITLADVTEKFTPRIDGRQPCHCIIAECGWVPFGYCQYYLNRDFLGAGINLAERPDGVSIDCFIGEPRYLKRGLGSRMLDVLGTV